MAANYILVVLVACFLICAAAQQNRYVYNFRSATWNTDGPRWLDVQRIMIYNQLDVFAIQEAGIKRSIEHQLIPMVPQAPIYVGNFVVDDNGGVTEYSWNISPRQNFYMYYYSTTALTQKQNMAIISRHRAAEVIVIPPEVTHASTSAFNEEGRQRTFINRPVIGICFEKSCFLNIHTQEGGRDAKLLLTSVINYMAQQDYAHYSWIVMGDYNKTPAALQHDFSNLLNIVGSASVTRTRSNKELDYGVVSVPGIQQIQLIPLQQNPSDHIPVQFN